MPFRRTVAEDELWDGEMLGLAVDGRRVLLVRLGGHVRAFEDACAHQRVPLSEGRLDGSKLTCRAHQWEYDLRTGGGINPAEACLRGFETKVEGGFVWVDVDGGEDSP